MKKLITLVVLCSVVSLTLFSQQSSALTGNDFNPGRIIDDSIFFDPSGMSVSTIQAFLNSKVPVCDTYHPSSNPSYQPPFTCLKEYRQDVQGKSAEPGLCNGISAGNKSSAEIIFEVSQSCGVSPKALIVLLEKEQGLVTDTWPWSIQYRSATGYGCPDTAPCDAEYYGFSNQLYNAARQFKKYARDESQFRYRAYRANYIQYNPDASCGGSDVVIENQATAGLYNYTPYQPNPATKTAAPGQTVACGAYGNINFWRYFNNWFGPTSSEGYSLMTSANDNGDTRQWIVSKGYKRHVPSAEVLRAWGLDQVPLIQVSGLYLGAVPTASQPLDRLMRPTGTLDVYFVDNAMCYRLTSPDAFAAWGLNPAAIVDVSEDLARLPTNKGDITYSVKTAASPSAYLMDGGVLRQFQNPDTKDAFEGAGTPITILSQEYLSRVPLAGAIPSPRVIDGSGNTFIISNRTKLSISSQFKDLFPWSPVSVSSATLQRMGSGSIQLFVRTEGDPRVYLVDQQQKHHIIDPNILNAWQANGLPTGVSVLSTGVTNLMSDGAQVRDYFASDGASTYVLNKTKKQIPPSLVTAYTGTRTIFNSSTTLLNLFENSGTVSNFVKAEGQPQAYLLTNSGALRHITSTQKYNLWAGAQSVTELSPDNVARYTMGGGIGAFVNNGSTNYVMDGGQKSAVDSTTKADWGFGNPDVLADGTLNNFATGTALSNSLQNANQYFLVSEGVGYGTVDKNIADIWSVDTAPVHNVNLISEFLARQSLTRFVVSKTQSDTRLFVVDNGVLYHLTPQHAANLNATGPYAYVNPEAISKQPITLWGGILVKNDSDTYYVVDGGGKRSFGNSIVFDHWRRTVPLSSIPSVSDGFTNSLPNKGIVDRAVKGSGGAIYSADSITKRWIRSTQTYSSQFATYTQVSDALIFALPDGSDIQ